MSGKFWNTQDDDVIRDNFWSMKAESIAAMLDGRTTKSIQHRAKVLGLRKTMSDKGRISNDAWIDALSTELNEPVKDWLLRRYVSEKASYRELTKEAGINTRSLMKLLRRYSIDPISNSEAGKRQIAKAPDSFRRFRLAGIAPDAKRKAALTRQDNWQKYSSDRETEFLNALHNVSLFPIREYAIDVFNIDFAFVDVKLAVELDPRWHNTDKKLKTDKRKDDLTSSLGWTTLRLDARASTSFNVQKVVAALASTQSIPV